MANKGAKTEIGKALQEFIEAAERVVQAVKKVEQASKKRPPEEGA